MKNILLLMVTALFSNAVWATESVYEKYPVGIIDENMVFDLLNKNKEQLRSCHQKYLEKIPGAFDNLGFEFMIDPKGTAKPMKTESASAPKDEAINCLKTLVRSLKFPIPNYGVVFVRFESDIDVQNQATIINQELARTSIQYKPYMPRKVINSIVEMYMPYYKGCFLPPYMEKKDPGKLTLKWNISEEGRATDIELVTSMTGIEKLSQCLTQVTEQHRYPSGYIKTSYEMVLNQLKVIGG